MPWKLTTELDNLVVCEFSPKSSEFDYLRLSYNDKKQLEAKLGLNTKLEVNQQASPEINNIIKMAAKYNEAQKYLKFTLSDNAQVHQLLANIHRRAAFSDWLYTGLMDFSTQYFLHAFSSSYAKLTQALPPQSLHNLTPTDEYSSDLVSQSVELEELQARLREIQEDRAEYMLEPMDFYSDSEQDDEQEEEEELRPASPRP